MLGGGRSLTYRVCNRCLRGHLKEKRGLWPLFPNLTTLGSEPHGQVHEDLPAERVVDLRERVAVAEDRWVSQSRERRRRGAAHDRRILVEQVVDPGAQREGLVDRPQARQVEVV